MAKKKSYSNASHDNDIILNDEIVEEENTEVVEENVEEVAEPIEEVQEVMPETIEVSTNPEMPEIEEEPIAVENNETIAEEIVEVPVEKKAVKQKKHYKVIFKDGPRQVIVNRGDDCFITISGPFEHLKPGDEFDY